MNKTWKQLQTLLSDAVSRRITPCVAAAIGTRKSSFTLFQGFEDSSLSKTCHEKSLFDLASLTKVIATTFVAADAVADGKVSLDESPFSFWPRIRVIDLLTHRSGLPAWIDFSKNCRSKHEIYEHLYAILPADPVHTMYSDLGFIALGHFLEKRLKKPLDCAFSHLLEQHVPRSHFFFPNRKIHTEKLSFVPTGFCPLRRRILSGDVNDTNAYLMGGTAPHAGLFGTVKDVAAFSEFLLATRYRKNPVSKMLNGFSSYPGIRGIGFDKATPMGSTAGVLSPAAFGHLGFTGTSMWIDPIAANGKGAYFVLLTNHTMAQSSKKDLLVLRQQFHRLASRFIQQT